MLTSHTAVVDRVSFNGVSIGLMAFASTWPGAVFRLATATDIGRAMNVLCSIPVIPLAIFFYWPTVLPPRLRTPAHALFGLMYLAMQGFAVWLVLRGEAAISPGGFWYRVAAAFASLACVIELIRLRKH